MADDQNETITSSNWTDGENIGIVKNFYFVNTDDSA